MTSVPANNARSRADAGNVVHVDLGERSYRIVVGEEVLSEVGARMREVLPAPRVVIITDTNVAPLYLEPLQASLDAAGIRHAHVILPAGEHTKRFSQLESLAERVLDEGIERTTALIALGGGVVGDITGFAAGVLLRGLPYIQVPTTLLAQVDSSVGGKTGINTRQGKNLVGLFHQPRLVLADVATLASLDPRQLRAGYAEVVKYGLIGDQDFFGWLESSGPAVCRGDRAAQQQAVLVSCAAKAAVVAGDEREAGQRALLNLGHTFGHALEAETGFGDALLHGEAVAIGMVLAFDLSVRLGLCPADDADRVRRHLAATGLPTALGAAPGGGPGRSWSPERLIDHMTRDKKVQNGRITFVLAHGIGKAFVSRDVSLEDVYRLLRNAVQADPLPS
jgi:3-dehydroquinate synthase